MRGYTLLATYGCYGCHEINGFQGDQRIGPDLRVEPPYAAIGANSRIACRAANLA